MEDLQFSSVWDAIEDTQGQAENMRLRSILLMALKNHIAVSGMTQAEVAQQLGVLQPRVSDLECGKINLFDLEELVSMIVAAGLRIDMQVIEAKPYPR